MRRSIGEGKTKRKGEEAALSIFQAVLRSFSHAGFGFSPVESSLSALFFRLNRVTSLAPGNATAIAELSPAQLTEMVRDASNWAFKLDLQESEC